MESTKDVRLHHGGEFKKTEYVNGESICVTAVDLDLFSYSVLMEYVKDYLHLTTIGGIYVSMGKRGGWQLVLDDKDVTNCVEGCADGEEIQFYIDNNANLDIEPLPQMQPHVSVRPRKNIIQDSAIKLPLKRQYTTAHLLQQQKKLKQKKQLSPQPQLRRSKRGESVSPQPQLRRSKRGESVSPQPQLQEKVTRKKLDPYKETEDEEDTPENEVDVQLPPPPPLTQYEIERAQRMQHNDMVCKQLGVPSIVKSLREDAHQKKRKGKDLEGGDDYFPEIEVQTDDSEIISPVKAKKPPAGPRTRSRAIAALEIETEADIDKEPTQAAIATPKQHKKACTEKEATSSYRPSLLKPTCRKLLINSGDDVPAGSVAAYLALRKRQKQNIVAPTAEEAVEIHQGEPTNEEVEAVQAPRKPRGRTKMSKVHARTPDDKVVITLNELAQPVSEDQSILTELSNFLGTIAKDNVSLTYVNWHVVPGQLKKQMWEYALARYVIPEEGHKWVMHTLNEAWRRYKSRMKSRYYKKYQTDEERLEGRPETIPLEDFKMLLKYWGDESVQALAEDNAAHRNRITETHTMGPKTHAQAKEKLKMKAPILAEPSLAELYLETYKRDPDKNYKTNADEQLEKYMTVKALVESGRIDEANALVSGGKAHGRTWLVGRVGKQGPKSAKKSQNAPIPPSVQELTTRIRQEVEIDLEAKVNTKVKENMSWVLKNLAEANPDLKINIADFCATASSDQEDNGTPTQGGSDFQ